MGSAQFRDGDTLFLCRVAGVAVDGDCVLLVRSELDDFWFVPGGRIEVGETAQQALRREMLEELGVEVGVGGVLWVIENFFRGEALDRLPGSAEGLGHHELGLYLEMRLPPGSPLVGAELVSTPHEFALEFRWFAREEIAGLDVQPDPLRELLSSPPPVGRPTVVNREWGGVEPA